MAVLALDSGAQTCAIFTRNAFRAAPVQVARRHLRTAPTRYCLVNSGNANAGTGERGIAACLKTCRELARLGSCATEAVLPFSTGIIGKPLPVDRVTRAIPQALDALDPCGWDRAARAIMTTDRRPKSRSLKLMIADREIAVTGVAKGAGMIRPDMATMLAFIAVEAEVDQHLLDEWLRYASARSFNRITVDGDTSPNDAVVLIAGGAGPRVRSGSPEADSLRAAVWEVCDFLAGEIVRDGEGASRVLTIEVEQGRDVAECLDVAYTVAESPLVKTAVHSGTPNWGRILAAIGRSGLEDLCIEDVEFLLEDVPIVKNGERIATFQEERARRVMARLAYRVIIRLGRGEASAAVRTCDLSREYVTINADYHS